jgi:hypothetical protein
MGKIISSVLPPICKYNSTLLIPFKSYSVADTEVETALPLIISGRTKSAITGGSEKMLWVVFKNPVPTANESELTSRKRIPPILFITPIESFCPIP